MPDHVDHHGTPVPVPDDLETAVSLVRMEGTLNRVLDKVNDLLPRVVKLEQDSIDTQFRTRSLEQAMEAEARTRVTLAAALKEADEARRAKSDDTWTPFQRTFAAMAGVAAVVALLIQGGYLGG